MIYAGERVSTDLQEVNAVAKMLISKYRCVGGWCVCGVCFGGVGVCVWVGGGGGLQPASLGVRVFPGRHLTADP